MTLERPHVGCLLSAILLTALVNSGCRQFYSDPVNPAAAAVTLRFFYDLSFGTDNKLYQTTWVNGQYVLAPLTSSGGNGNARPNEAHTATASSFPSTSPTGQGVALSTSQSASTVAGTIYMPDAFTNSILVVDVATNQQTGKIPMSGTPFDVVISPDRSTLYAATFPPVGGVGTAAIAIVNLATQAVTGTIPLSGSYPQWMAISPDGATLYCADNQAVYSTSANALNQLLVIDLTAGKVKATVQDGSFTESAIGRPVASPDGSAVYEPAFGEVLAIDTVSLQASFTIPVSPHIGSRPASHTAITPDGRYLYIPTSTGVAAVDTATGKTVASIALPGTSLVVQDVAISSDGGAVMAVEGVSGNLYQIDPATNSLVATFAPGAGITPNAGTNALLVMQ